VEARHRPAVRGTGTAWPAGQPAGRAAL